MSKLHDGKEEMVEKSFVKFVQSHITDANLSVIDEILFPYIVSILDEIASQKFSQDAFDVDHFTEMMSAYVPRFVEINRQVFFQDSYLADVSEWMYNLAFTLSKCDDDCSEFKSLFPKEINDTEDEDIPKQNIHCTKVAEDIEPDFDTSSEKDDEDDLQIHLLQEMFPTACTAEVRHCLSIADGSTEKAAQLVLHRQETGQSLTMTKPLQAQKSIYKKEQDDNALRQHILSRYMYVDQSEDKREHKPVAPKWEPKKLVRYRNNQIVSLKGEKYTEVHTAESEEVKKSYVTIKPARQYRFH
uniref:CUE domain-containing protein n=1 Tax=Strigamia maritima TaxID=126957 RepID=T1JF40_STRMM